MSPSSPPDPSQPDIQIDTEGDATIGSLVGRDAITNTTNTTTTTHIEGGPTARYAILGIALVAVIAIGAVLLATLGPQWFAPAASPSPTLTASLTPAALASQTHTPPAPSATAPQPTLTLAPSHTPTPPLPTDTLRPPTPTAIAYFRANCIPASLWNSFPRASSLGGCLALTNFLAQADGLVIKHTQTTSGERQQGIYLPLANNATISFTLTVNQLSSQNERTNLAFGIVNTTNGFSYVNGSVYLCYFSVRRALESSVPMYLNPGNSSCIERPTVRALPFETPQQLSFSLTNGRLIITVDDQPVFDDFLAFTSRAFYLGYDAHDQAEITTILSQFTVTLDD